MFALEVVESFTHEDGRLFEVGHNCKQLSIFEASELLYDFPGKFKPANELTEELVSDQDKLEHYALAKKSQGG